MEDQEATDGPALTAASARAQSSRRSFGLQNLQKLRDGERIDGRMRPEDEFEAIETGAADLDELLA